MTPALHQLVGAAIGEHHTTGMNPTIAGAILAIATAAVDAHTPATYPTAAQRCPHPRVLDPGPGRDQWEHDHPFDLDHRTLFGGWFPDQRRCTTTEETVCSPCTEEEAAPVAWPCSYYTHLAQALDQHKARLHKKRNRS